MLWKQNRCKHCSWWQIKWKISYLTETNLLFCLYDTWGWWTLNIVFMIKFLKFFLEISFFFLTSDPIVKNVLCHSIYLYDLSSTHDCILAEFFSTKICKITKASDFRFHLSFKVCLIYQKWSIVPAYISACFYFFLVRW